MFSGGVRESEKSNSTRCSLSPRPDGPDADVVGLDVAVGDALLLEEPDHVRAGPRRIAGADRGAAGPPCGAARPASPSPARRMSRQTRPPISSVSQMLDDVLVAELLQDLALVPQPVVVLRGAGDLEDQFLAVPLDQQGHRAGPGPSRCLTTKPPGSLSSIWACVGSSTTSCSGLESAPARPRRDTPGIREPSRAGCVTSGMGAALNQVLEVLAGAVEDRTDLQPLGLAEFLAQFQGVGWPAAGRRTGGRRSRPARRCPGARRSLRGPRVLRGPCRPCWRPRPVGRRGPCR